MTKKELLISVKNKLNNNELVEIFRYNIDDCSILASLNSISENLLLVQQTGEFTTDGYKILRNADISEIVTCDKNENLKFTNMIFSKEKLFSEKISVSIGSWNVVFNNFKKNKKTVMIECSYDDAVDYYFGKITDIKGNIAYLQCFDGAGVLFNDIVKINIDFVSSLTFDDRYTTLMSKYVKW